MRVGETNVELRRILLTIQLADGSGLATSVDSGSPTILVSQNGAALTAATGALHHVSTETRQHYYEASASEALTPGFLLVVVVDASIQTAIGWAPVGQIFALGEANPALLRLPLTIYTDGEPPALATGATVTTASDLQSSINARAFANDPGSLVEIGDGAYYWQATATAAAEHGFVELKYESTGFGVCLSWVSVDDLSTSTTPVTPVGPDAISVITPQGAYPTIDYIERALSRLPHQYRGPDKAHETNTQKVIRVLLCPVPDLATAMIAVLTQRNVDNAVGAQLDAIGKRVGRLRQGVTDDDIYRRYIRAQITANRSDGIIKDILDVAGLVIDDDDATFTMHNYGTAAYLLIVGGIAVPLDIASVLVALVTKATSGGVRPLVEWSGYAPGDTFTCDTGPGEDVGHYASAVDGPF